MREAERDQQREGRVDDLHYYTHRENSVREVEEHSSYQFPHHKTHITKPGKKKKKKKSKWVLKKTIQAKPTSQNARKSNPNRIFT